MILEFYVKILNVPKATVSKVQKKIFCICSLTFFFTDPKDYCTPRNNFEAEFWDTDILDHEPDSEPMPKPEPEDFKTIIKKEK